MNQTVVLGITGGIAAYKMLGLVTLLKEQNITVIVIETLSATRIVSPKQFTKVGATKVLTQLFEQNFDYLNILKARRVEHIDVAQSSNLLVIAPATANVIAKLATGIADDYLTTTVLAATCPIIIYPSMNTAMWRNPITQKNVAILRSIGMNIMMPSTGKLACGTEGEGRLPAVKDIANDIGQVLRRGKSLQNKKIIVTAGSTREPIDAVRFITNRSSGKMGIALAETAYLHGANVTLLRSTTSVTPRYPMEEVLFDTADDLESILHQELLTADIVIHTAAVSDFVVSKTSGKLSSKHAHVLTLHPRRKIIDSIKKRNPNIFLVAFKAEAGLSDEQLVHVAKNKLKESGADLVVGNHIDRPNQGFGVDTNEVWIVTKQNKITHVPLAPKRIVAEKILNALP